jgi:hypothetical protein
MVSDRNEEKGSTEKENQCIEEEMIGKQKEREVKRVRKNSKDKN